MTMMRSEDGEHGTRGVAGYPVGRSKALEEATAETARTVEELAKEEIAEADGEPIRTIDDVLKGEDLAARAYASVWGHYEAAFNAVAHRAASQAHLALVFELMEVFLGRSVLEPDKDLDFAKLLHEARLERQRLLAQIERNVETVATQADSLSSQQRLISDMARHATNGKRAVDALMLLGVRLGINPVPMEAEEFCASVMAAFAAAKQEGTTSNGNDNPGASDGVEPAAP